MLERVDLFLWDWLGKEKDCGKEILLGGLVDWWEKEWEGKKVFGKV